MTPPVLLPSLSGRGTRGDRAASDPCRCRPSGRFSWYWWKPDLPDTLDVAVFSSTGCSCPGDCPGEKPTPEPSPEIWVDILPDPDSSTVFLMILKETVYVATVLNDVSHVGSVLKVCAHLISIW